MPGFLGIQAAQRRDAEDRRRREEAWWQGVVAMVDAGQVEEAVQQTGKRAGSSRFVLDPLSGSRAVRPGGGSTACVKGPCRGGTGGARRRSAG